MHVVLSQAPSFLCCLSLGAIAWPSAKLKDKQASTQLSSLCTNSHRRLDLIPPLQQPLTSPSFVNERPPIQPYVTELSSMNHRRPRPYNSHTKPTTVVRAGVFTPALTTVNDVTERRKGRYLAGGGSTCLPGGRPHPPNTCPYNSHRRHRAL